MKCENQKKINNTKQTRRVAVLVTGGTIVCSYNPVSKVSTPSLGMDALIETLPALPDAVEIVPREIFRLQGTQLTLEHGMAIAGHIYEVLQDSTVCGAVVVQGTDTMDEMAYLASLLIGPGDAAKGASKESDSAWYTKPVIFTGAMKSICEPYSDGVGNLYGAILAAADTESHGKGVMVYMNQCLYDAERVEKAHSNRIDAFTSFSGPIGTIENDTVRYQHNPVRDYTFPRLLNQPSSAGQLPQDIYILKSYAGMDDQLLRACLSFPAKGIILEGLGSGNVQPAVVAALSDVLDQGIPVVITTRCFSGITYGNYDYEGGGADLLKKGVIFSGGLNSQKARIKLSVLLAAGVESEALSSYF